MIVLRRVAPCLLSSSLGKTLLGPVVTTGSAVLLGISAGPQPAPLLVGRMGLVLMVGRSMWCGVRCSELERAASKSRSTDLEDRLRGLILTTRSQSVAAAERAEQAAVGALQSSLGGLEAQAASGDLAVAAIARDELAFIEQEGLIDNLGEGFEALVEEVPLR